MYRRAASRQANLPGISFRFASQLQPPVAEPPVKLEQRGLALAAMGLVRRSGGHFTVSSAILRGAAAPATVNRSAGGALRCNCSEFSTRSVSDPQFRCEHIFAVQHFAQDVTVLRDPRAAGSPAASPGSERPVPSPQPVRDRSMSLVSEKRVPEPARSFSGDPQARSFAELVSPRQLAVMRQLARNRAIDAEHECGRTLGCAMGDLSKAAASFYIEHLLAMPTEAEMMELRLAS